jgi:hypothetical protein
MSPTVRNLIWVAAALMVSLLAGAAWVWWATSREVATPVTALSTAGTQGRALLVYQPGLSDFPDRITAAFADGLARSGWRVDRTTASVQAPSDLGRYDLLVLASPVYGNRAAAPLTAYVERAHDFAGKPVALVFTAAGDAGPALDASTHDVAAHHGRVVGRFGYTTQRPNEPVQTHAGSNIERAIAMARDAGAALHVAAP